MTAAHPDDVNRDDHDRAATFLTTYVGRPVTGGFYVDQLAALFAEVRAVERERLSGAGQAARVFAELVG